MRIFMVLLLLMLPTYYVNAQNICVDYKTDPQVDAKYVLTIKRKMDFVEYNDVIKVTKYDHKLIQVFEIKKTIPELKRINLLQNMTFLIIQNSILICIPGIRLI